MPMPSDPYAVLRALLRAEARRGTAEPHAEQPRHPHRAEPHEQRPPTAEEPERD
ncbi:hypothetical protein [Streptomyces sp. NPDC046197]|uniref:hypothetical protein n=1 Tax=Streptomyces sp. NPDC046197 TaxID=3154337 RepID=UPI0033E22352